MSIHDRLFCQSPQSAADGAFLAINGLQDNPDPAVQVIGAACAFKNYCDVLNLDPRELLYAVARMEADCRYRQVNTLAAVREYIHNEIRSKFP